MAKSFRYFVCFSSKKNKILWSLAMMWRLCPTVN